ncbi:MAG: transporter substrate-binding domain-containing protein [Burkholderiales bacterium]|jgi:polar amino acid transport system substrate-binding protein|nr:MAG: transporter substrate-binding domain-containing protein [Burkholderiales bacterium]
MYPRFDIGGRGIATVCQLLAALVVQLLMQVAQAQTQTQTKTRTDKQTVDACADRAEMPPFTFTERANGQLTGRVVGASVDILASILKASGQRLEVHLLPWARCLAEVDAGRVQLALNVSQNEADHRSFRLTHAYFRTHAVALFARSRYPNGLDLRAPSAWASLKVCGFGGHRFEHFGLDSSVVDRGTTQSYDQVIAKLNLGRCDLFIDSREVIGGTFLVNHGMRAQLAHGTIDLQALSDVPPQALYFGVADSGPSSTALLQLLNQGLEELERHNELNTIVGRYMQ